MAEASGPGGVAPDGVVTFTMMTADFAAAGVAVCRESKTIRAAKGRVFNFHTLMTIVLLILVTMAAMAPRNDYWIPRWIWAAFLPASFLPFAVSRLLSRYRLESVLQESPNRNALGRWEARLTADAIHLRSEFTNQSTRWEGVERVVATHSHVFFFWSTISCATIPARCFDNPERFRAFCDLAQRYHQAKARGRCEHCGYDLLGSASGRCPECGRAPTAEPESGARDRQDAPK
ncbi:MAG: YcxB family protein [Phycisphaerales bacterium]|nr:YcxB family protein [Phycisphaerales bacterium]